MSFEEPTLIERSLEPLGYHLLYFHHRDFVDRLGLVGDERVLDFGCGGGASARHIVKRLTTGHLTCLDISEFWLDRTRRRVGRDRVDYHLGRVDDLDSSFDAVLIHYVIHDIPDGEREGTVSSLVERMDVGARLLVQEPTKEGHGMPPEELDGLMGSAGLRKTESSRRRSTYTAVYHKVDTAP